MSHNLMSDQSFYSFRQPAWHKLGFVSDSPHSAQEAYEKIGKVAVWTEGLVTSAGLSVPEYKAICTKAERGADGQPGPSMVVSVVGKDYNEITHGDFVKAFDSAIGQPVETLGILGKGGEKLFATVKLPSFDVKGDECNNYLLAYSPLSGVEAVTIRITPVRVVCQNTLIMSASDCSDEFRITHSQAMCERVGAWLGLVWGRIEERAAAVKEALEILASFPLGAQTRDAVLSEVYPLPERPNTTDRDRLQEWERACERERDHQLHVLRLYQGAAVGAETDAFRGTAFGLYNAVVEYEDYARKRRRAASAVFGIGADRKQTAYATLKAAALALR